MDLICICPNTLKSCLILDIIIYLYIAIMCCRNISTEHSTFEGGFSCFHGQKKYKIRVSACRISSYSCHGNYSFLEFSNFENFKYFVAFCSFFPCSLTVFIQGRQQKSGGRQQKSSRADKQHCFP